MIVATAVAVAAGSLVAADLANPNPFAPGRGDVVCNVDGLNAAFDRSAVYEQREAVVGASWWLPQLDDVGCTDRRTVIVRDESGEQITVSPAAERRWLRIGVPDDVTPGRSFTVEACGRDHGSVTVIEGDAPEPATLALDALDVSTPAANCEGNCRGSEPCSNAVTVTATLTVTGGPAIVDVTIPFAESLVAGRLVEDGTVELGVLTAAACAGENTVSIEARDLTSGGRIADATFTVDVALSDAAAAKPECSGCGCASVPTSTSTLPLALVAAAIAAVLALRRRLIA